MSVRVVVPYEHDPADLGPVDLALTDGTQPGWDSWRPALRDVIGGRRVVWVRADTPPARVWIRDRDGQRQAGAL